MGFLTPILIRNDCLHFFKDKKLRKEICDKIHNACLRNYEQSIPISNHCNAIESLGSEHADCVRVIIIIGNSWIDIRDDIWNNKREDEDYINYLKNYSNILKDKLKDIKDKIKKLENNK